MTNIVRHGERGNRIDLNDGDVGQLSDFAPKPKPLPEIPAARDADIGRLSAKAVQSQYEQAAKNVEAMGEAVKERILALETSLNECDKDMKLLAEAASAIREKGRLAYANIEHTAQVSKEIRAVCAEFQKKFEPNGKDTL
jgi:predicted ribosome quality control (RQC) complex YloA/Tae2 family protein